MLDDTKTTDPKHSLPELLDRLDRALFAVSGKLPGYPTLNTALASISDGNQSVAISGEYHSLNEFQLASNGQEIRKVSMPTIMRYRDGDTATNKTKGDPLLIAFLETAAGAVTAHFWPTAWQGDTIYGLGSAVPVETFRGQAGADLSSVTLSFGVYGIEAILYHAAGMMDEYSAALRDENLRINKQRSSQAPTFPTVSY